MKSIATTILSISSVAANISQRQSTPGCCFQLAAVGDINAVVGEGRVGDFLLGGSLQETRFCLDETTRTIKDGRGNTCFVKALSERVACATSIFGDTSFDITDIDAYGMSYLTHSNGIKRFHACPAPWAHDKSYYIYSDDKQDKTGCFEISLSLKDQAAECHASNMTTIGTTSAVVPSASQPLAVAPTSTSTESLQTLIPPTTRPLPTITVPAPESTTTTPTSELPLSETPPLETLTPSQTCTVAPSSPSVAPRRVGYPDAKSPDGIHDSLAEVSISRGNSTIFEYSIPPSFPPMNASHDGPPPQCALQFRMPVCSELPKGYPCYTFSGLEQEKLSDSGINFKLRGDDDAETPWDDTALHQVFPGESSIVGTFECGSLNGTGDEDRTISWEATSVRNFFLEFLQAGVGENPEFQDGIGAWIVPCV